MLGLVASMGIAGLAGADGPSTTAAPVAAPPSPAPLDTTLASAASPVTAPPVTIEVTQPGTGPAPVTLTARPDVRVIEQPAAPAPAPAATTSGSR